MIFLFLMENVSFLIWNLSNSHWRKMILFKVLTLLITKTESIPHFESMGRGWKMEVLCSAGNLTQLWLLPLAPPSSLGLNSYSAWSMEGSLSRPSIQALGARRSCATGGPILFIFIYKGSLFERDFILVQV